MAMAVVVVAVVAVVAVVVVVGGMAAVAAAVVAAAMVVIMKVQTTRTNTMAPAPCAVPEPVSQTKRRLSAVVCVRKRSPSAVHQQLEQLQPDPPAAALSADCSCGSPLSAQSCPGLELAQQIWRAIGRAGLAEALPAGEARQPAGLPAHRCSAHDAPVPYTAAVLSVAAAVWL